MSLFYVIVAVTFVSIIVVITVAIAVIFMCIYDSELLILKKTFKKKIQKTKKMDGR